MATVKQIQYRLGQAKKKLAKLSKEAAGAKGNVKKLEGQLKNARAAAKKKPKKKKAAKKSKYLIVNIKHSTSQHFRVFLAISLRIT